MEKKIKIRLTCGVRMTQLKSPVKGRWCEHYTCLDLESYLLTNKQYPRWICPECKSKTVKLYRDEFTIHLLDKAHEDDTQVLVDCY